MNGLAGTGKSTIAQTIAERMVANGKLGASFFCSRDFEDRRNLRLIFSTLAVQLAQRYTEIRSILVPLVRSDPGITQESPHGQMKKMIVQPLMESGISTVIIIDALDECKDHEPASVILSVLGQFLSQIPKVKFFLTGRPEPRIREGFRLYLPGEVKDVFILHDIEPSIVGNDIQLFLEQSFLELAHRRCRPDGWPTVEQLDQLCERAAGFFVYAVATIKFVDHQRKKPEIQLDRLLCAPKSSVYEGNIEFKSNTSLDSLYMSILQDAFDDHGPEDDQMVQSILGALVLATNPLSPSTIATILGFDTEETFLQLSSVHSLLILQEDFNFPVRSFHKSFPDFITDSTRCTNKRFHISPTSHHPELLLGCLKLMNQSLEKNMCKLPDATANSEVKDLYWRTEQYINPALQYACKSWHKHLIDECDIHREAITSTLHCFLEQKFLFWLEILSVLGAAKEAIDALKVAGRWSKVSQTFRLDVLPDLLRFNLGITHS